MGVKRAVRASGTEEQTGMKEQEKFCFIMSMCGFPDCIIMKRENDS